MDETTTASTVDATTTTSVGEVSSHEGYDWASAFRILGELLNSGNGRVSSKVFLRELERPGPIIGTRLYGSIRIIDRLSPQVGVLRRDQSGTLVRVGATLQSSLGHQRVK